MSKKTIGDYMRMMNGVEKENNEDEVSESKCNCEGDCQCKEVNESIKISGIEPIFTEYQNFKKYTDDMMGKFKEFITSDINTHVDIDESLTCYEYLIIGVTIEQGVMTVLKCTNEFDEEKNLYFEIGIEGVVYKGEV